MKTALETLTPTRVRLQVDIDAADMAPALDKAYRAIGSQITIPGFRKGKVPKAVIDQRVGAASVLSEAINEAVPTAYESAVKEHSLVPLGQPDINIADDPTLQGLSFTAEVDVRPEF